MYPYFSILGRTLPSYGLCMAMGIIAASCVAFFRARKRGLDTDALIIMGACAIGMALVGAKVLYLLVSCDLAEVAARVQSGDLSDFAGGGQVFYGGLIGGGIGFLIGKKISGVSEDLAAYCEAIMPAIPLGHAFGRVGCFLGGCCYGAPYTGIGAVRFLHVGVMEPVFPVQILEAILNLVIFGVLVAESRKTRARFHSLYLYLMLYAVVRFVLEFFRGDQIRGITGGYSTSQWISIVLFLCGLTAWIRSLRGSGDWQ